MVWALTILSGPNIKSGGTVNPGADVAVYSIELGDLAQDLVSIAVRIDGAGPNPISAADIDRLSLWTDPAGPPWPTNGILEPTDILIGEQTTVALGTMITVSDPAPFGSESLGPGPNGRWFYVAIRFKDSAAGKYFTVRATTPPDNIVAEGPPGPPGTFWFASGPGGPGARIWVYLRPPEVRIPVGYEWVAGLGFFACGIYGLLRARRRRAQS
jgi:hypothetical protein